MLFSPPPIHNPIHYMQARTRIAVCSQSDFNSFYGVPSLALVSPMGNQERGGSKDEIC